MDARPFFLPILSLVASLAAVLGGFSNSSTAYGADLRTPNFIVSGARDPNFARTVATHAERCRRELALYWLGRELGPWETPCMLHVVAGDMPAQGVTKYVPEPGRVRDFQMEVIGTRERILDSVLPHEMTHAVLATHFKRPLPRWADEGISTTVEHRSEKSKHDLKLREFLTSGRGIPMNRMFLMKEYPAEMLTLYAQGYSVSRFLLEQGGPREFIHFLETYFQQGSWTEAVREHYSYESLGELQDYWLQWVQSGSGEVTQFVKIQTAAGGTAEQLESGISSAPAIATSNPPGSALPGSAANRHEELSRAAPTSDPPTLALATSTSGDGWYQNRRERIRSGVADTSGPLALSFPGPNSPHSSTSEGVPPNPPAPPTLIGGLPDGPSTFWSPAPATSWRR